MRKDLPCPWRLGGVLPLARDFCRAQLGKALQVCSTPSAHRSGGDAFTCFAMRLLVVSQRPVTTQASSNAGLFQQTPKQVMGCPMGSLLGSPASRSCSAILPGATLAHWLDLLDTVPMLGVAHDFMVGFGASPSRGAAVRQGVNQPLSLPGFRK